LKVGTWERLRDRARAEAGYLKAEWKTWLSPGQRRGGRKDDRLGDEETKRPRDEEAESERWEGRKV